MLAFLAALGAAVAAFAVVPPGRADEIGPAPPGGGAADRSILVLLPVQDLAGNPRAAVVVEDELRARLSEHHTLANAATVRDALRRLRIRDSGSIPPAVLDRLAGELGAGAFFSATLHRASGGDVPEVTLSGRGVGADRPTLAWAGFEAASGLDEARWLGLGRVRDLETLVRQAVRRLVRDFDGERHAPRRGVPSVKGAVLVDPRPISGLGVVAVIPFDVAADAPGAGEMATALALAVLFRHGAALAAPGAVEEVLRQRGTLLRGEIDGLTRAALRAAGQAGAFFTGTVEECALESGGPDPEPRAAIAARLIEAGSGRILWTAGLERRGRDREGAFELRRVRATGALLEEIMESLVNSLTGPAARPSHGDRP